MNRSNLWQLAAQVRRIGILLTAFTAPAAPARAAGYSFAPVADQRVAPVLVPSAINAHGTVAFTAFRDDSGSAVYTGRGGPLTVVADHRYDDPDTPFVATQVNGPAFGRYVSMNDAGTVALRGQTRDGFAVYLGDGGALTAVAGPGRGFLAASSPSLDNAGDVAFVGTREDRVYGTFLAGPSGSARPVVSSLDGPFAFFSAPKMSPTGTVAVVGAPDLRGPYRVYVGDGSSPARVVLDSQGTFASFGTPSINDSGAIAFFATGDDGGRGIYLLTDGAVQTVADTSGEFASFDPDVAINADGTVVFGATLRDGRSGIFASRGGRLSEVVMDGDLIAGRRVFDVQYAGALNDAGQVGFTYRPQSGQLVVAVATPVPEPTTLPAAAAFLFLMCRPRRR